MVRCLEKWRMRNAVIYLRTSREPSAGDLQRPSESDSLFQLPRHEAPLAVCLWRDSKCFGEVWNSRGVLLHTSWANKNSLQCHHSMH